MKGKYMILGFFVDVTDKIQNLKKIAFQSAQTSNSILDYYNI